MPLFDLVAGVATRSLKSRSNVALPFVSSADGGPVGLCRVGGRWADGDPEKLGLKGFRVPLVGSVGGGT